MIKLSAIKSFSLRTFILLQMLLVGNAFAQAPNPPTNVQATDGTSMTSIGVSWTAPGSGPAVDGYRIFRSTSNNSCAGAPLATISSALTSYSDTSGLSNNQVYYYSVASVSALNQQGLCSVADPGRLQSIDPPLPPVNVQATQNLLDKITVTWAMPSGSEVITNYKIFRSESSTAVCQGSPIANVGSSTFTFDDLTTPEAGRSYYYTLTSTGPNGESACTPTIAEGLRLLPPPPLPPANVTASDGTFTDKIRVQWQAPVGSTPITSYRLFKSLAPGLANACQNVIQDNIPATTLTLDDTVGVIPGKIYYYSMISRNATGIEGQCSEIDPGHAKVSAPANVQASDGTYLDKVEVTWVPPVLGGEITGYKIFKGDTPASVQTCNPANQIALTSALSYSDFSVVQDVIYYYALRAVSPSPAVDGECSPVDPGYARKIAPPANVDATDGTYPDKVRVSWIPPSPSSEVTGFKIYKSPTPLSCQTLIHTSSGLSPLFYDDMAVTPGILYYYSLRTTSSVGESNCSPIDSGFAKISPPLNVQATDGTYLDKVRVTWAPPASGQISGYKLYKSSTPLSCQDFLQSFGGSATVTYDDFAVVPDTLYYYSLRTVSPTGDSDCSPFDPGNSRKIAPPINPQATDGDFPDKVNVSWLPPAPSEGVTGFKIYRSPTPLSCQTLIQTVTSPFTTLYSDTAVVPGTTYYYSMKTTSAQGDSNCSPIDPGFAKKPVTICSNGLDDDLDGLIDVLDPGCKGDPNRNDEKDPDGPACDNGKDDDGDGKIDFRIDSLTDTSCSSPRDGTEDDTDVALKSPAYIKFNTYLGQWNYAELVNQGVGAKQVDLTLYNLYGQKMISRSYVVPAQSQVDVDVNALVQFACNVLKTACDKFVDHSEQGVPNGLDRPDGVVDTYGLVELVFDDDNTSERLLGRMSFYRPNIDGDFSFAFAREFKNPNKGTSYSTANTYDPQGSGYLVPNWAEVINLDTVSRGYTVNVYDQDGNLKSSKAITLAPLGEFDVQAGHEFIDANGKVVEGVFLVEVIPGNSTAPYYLSVSRYSSNSKPGVHPETYNYAMAIDGLAGTTDKIFAPIGNTISGISSLTDRPAITNWVEVVNVDTIPADITITFRSLNGSVLFSQGHRIAPKGQFHFNAGALLPKGTIGAVEIQSNAKVVSQGMSYAHGTDNGLQTGFTSVARPAGAQEQVGTINTFLGMKNAFEIVSTVPAGTDVDFKITTFSGATKTGVIGLGSGTNQSFQITDNSALNITENTYGAMILKSSSAGRFMGEVRRLRVSKGKLDFVMPTGVR